jgi:hypothetical protein
MDKRSYHKLFQFPAYITGVRRLYLLNRLPHSDAENTDLKALIASGRKCVVVFNNRVAQNQETHFHEIVGRQQEIHRALIQMTREEFRPLVQLERHVAIHVRTGDFTEVESVDDLRNGARNARLPIKWYCELLSGLRASLAEIPARVYSDGSDKVLEPLLSMPGVVRSPAQRSITDLLSLAQAGVLISSASGFSCWGAYLGSIPRICFPGQRFVRVLGEPGGIDLEPECETSSDLDERFLHLVSTRVFAPKAL